MLTARRLTIAFTFAMALVAVTAASAFAQGGSPNPSGGTSSCLPGLEDVSGAIDISAYLPRGFTIDLGVRRWISGFAASRFIVPSAGRPVSVRTLAAVAPRRAWSR